MRRILHRLRTDSEASADECEDHQGKDLDDFQQHEEGDPQVQAQGSSQVAQQVRVLKASELMGSRRLISLFFPYANSTYGTCYVFNLKLNQDNDTEAGSRKTVFPGPNNGLELELYLDASQWPSSVMSSQGGVRVVIHRSDSLPSPEESGFDARTGTATNIALRQMEVSRLPYPYENDCYDSWDKTGYSPSDPKLIAYDSLMCRRMCLQATMLNICHCTLPWIQDYFTFSNGTLNGTRACNTESYDSIGNQCINNVYEGVKNGSITCPCNAEC
ncbi:unnamed protein product, partial [Darwinula stevensoni]